MNDQPTNRLATWLSLATRQAMLDFQDGRRLDDEGFAQTPKCGPRITAAVRRVERVALPVLHDLAAKAKELTASRLEVESAAAKFDGMLEEMGRNVLSLVAFIAPESHAAHNEVRSRLHSLADDARRYLLEPEVPPPSSSRVIAFLPIDLGALGSTISAEDVLHRLSGNEQRDHALHINAVGEVAWQYQGKLVTAEEYERLMGPQFKRFEVAASIVLGEVRGGGLSSYVYSNGQRTCFHIPRFYWNGRTIAALTSLFEGMSDAQGGDESMIGQPVMFSEAKVEAWLPKAKAALERELEELNAAENDNAGQSRQTNKKPSWYPVLRQEFTRDVKRREEWPKLHPNDLPPAFPSAAAFRRRIIGKGWEGDRKPARTTVEYHVNALRREFKV